jgi:ubiquinone/menaquinone biosynthesis C-methylase UbiE
VNDTTNYEKLALFYDQLMQGIDYEAWVNYVEELVASFQGKVRSVVDLACGTGNSTIPWAKRGYHTIGVDLSAEMLDIACRKAVRQGYEIKFQQCDLCSFRLDQKVDLAVCFQDGFNYILDIKKLAAAFQSVFANLNEEGFFLKSCSLIWCTAKAISSARRSFTSGTLTLIILNSFSIVGKSI